MLYYYLDLETFGTGKRPDPARDTIICALVCAIDPTTGQPTQEPLFLHSWKSSEKALVSRLHDRFSGKEFDFVPVGFNVLFDLWFLRHKFAQHLRKDPGEALYLERPHVDLKQIMVFGLGRFKGVRLGPAGNPVHDWYDYGDYESIERHMRAKLATFCEEWEKWKGKLK
jgi:hypothetical protein